MTAEAEAGGYYGGYANQVKDDKYICGGAGGSGYISDKLMNAKTIAGNNSRPDYTEIASEYTGNGYVKITKLVTTTKVIYEAYARGIYQDFDCEDEMTMYDNPVEIPTGPKGYKFIGYYTQRDPLFYSVTDVGTKLIDEDGYITSDFTNTYFDKDSTIYAHWEKTFEDTVFYYTGEIEEIVLPKGTYKLETWGGQGGGSAENAYSSNHGGGKGGYSSGILEVKEKSKTLYVCVGEIRTEIL